MQSLPHGEYKFNHELKPVNVHEPCPICEKPDWCSVADDGSFAICMRVAEGSIKETANGGYLHILKNKPYRRQYSPPTFTPPKSPPAKPQVLNSVFQDLRTELNLSHTHEIHLLNDRGLAASEIRKLDYRTMPASGDRSGRATIMKQLVEKHGRKLLTVPGFYLTAKGHVWIAGTGGILLPCRNVDGHIVGYQIRSDEASGGKYIWLSANREKRKRGGVSSGTPIHVAGREYKSNQVWITEGIFKSDIAALRLQQTVIGIAGVSSGDHEELRKTLEKLNPETVVIAFDADWATNPKVKRALRRLAQAVLSMGYKVSWATWDIEQGKGIDDLLTNGHQPTLEPYSPPVDTEKLKTIGGEKRVRKALAPKIDTRTSPSVDALRTEMQDKIKNFAQHTDGGVLLVKGTQGIAKSTSSVEILDGLWRNEELRPVYAGPRHDLIKALTLNEWVHLHPRKPQRKELHEHSDTNELNQLMNEMIPYIGEGAGKVQLSELDILCIHSQRAEALAKKRWSVPKNLCLTDCEIGQTYGIDGCPYYMQYRTEKPIGTVHETLFIPTFCENIFGNEQLRLYGDARQVLIFDEPSPTKFYETVDIAPGDLSHAIVDAWDDNLKILLKLVRSVSENVAERITNGNLKKRLIGHEVMQELVDFAGGPDNLEKLLNDAKSGEPSKHQKVVIGIDGFLGETLKAWKVHIEGKVRFIPKALADPIDTESMSMVKGYALAQGFPIISEFEGDDQKDVPLNFCTDLLRALQREFDLYQSGRLYNSALVMTIKGKLPIIRLNLRKELAVPQHVPMLLLDAHGNADLLSRLLNREVKTWEAKIGYDTQVTQVVDGGYGITSLWNSKTGKPKSTLNRLLDCVVFPIVKQEPQNILIVTWKKVADYLRQLQEEGKLSKVLAIDHYGNLEGTNKYSDRKRCVLLGTPQVSPNDLEEMAHALFQNDEEPISVETEDRWEKYAYQDCDGGGYEVKARRYVDERVELLSRLNKEDELVQAAHRVRPVLNPGREIYLLTNLPIEELPPTRLTTIEELSASLGAEIQLLDKRGKLTKEYFNDFAVQFAAEHDSRISLRSLKPALHNAFGKMAIDNTNSGDGERGLLSMFPSESTLERWLRDLACREGWDRSRVTVELQNKPNGGGTWIYVYHEGELDEDAVRKEYAELLEAADGDVILIEPWPWDKSEPAVMRAQWNDEQTLGGFHEGKFNASDTMCSGADYDELV